MSLFLLFAQWRIQGCGPGPPPLLWVNEELITKERKTGRASKNNLLLLPPSLLRSRFLGCHPQKRLQRSLPPPHLSSRSGSATDAKVEFFYSISPSSRSLEIPPLISTFPLYSRPAPSPAAFTHNRPLSIY